MGIKFLPWHTANDINTSEFRHRRKKEEDKKKSIKSFDPSLMEHYGRKKKNPDWMGLWMSDV
jgi:hypothetical protein